MASSPYRVPAQAGPSSASADSGGSLELAGVAWFAWIVTILRVVIGVARAEAPGRELELAWLILFLAPVVIWKELQARRARP